MSSQPLTPAKPIPLRVLVVEPADIIWLGAQQILQDIGIHEEMMWRARSTNDLEKLLYYYTPHVLLLTSIGHGDSLFSLLNQLSLLQSKPNYKRPAVLVCPEWDDPHLPALLQGFGADVVLNRASQTATLTNILHGAWTEDISACPARLTPQERAVTQALLAGHSVSWVAKILGKNIRTVSAQKQSVLNKLKIRHTGELQVLGGRLATG